MAGAARRRWGGGPAGRRVFDILLLGEGAPAGASVTSAGLASSSRLKDCGFGSSRFKSCGFASSRLNSRDFGSSRLRCSALSRSARVERLGSSELRSGLEVSSDFPLFLSLAVIASRRPLASSLASSLASGVAFVDGDFARSCAITRSSQHSTKKIGEFYAVPDLTRQSACCDLAGPRINLSGIVY